MSANKSAARWGYRAAQAVARIRVAIIPSALAILNPDALVPALPSAARLVADAPAVLAAMWGAA